MRFLQVPYAVGPQAKPDDLPPLPKALIIAGGIAWMLAYVLAIRVGFSQHTFAFPIVAVALNITWEFFYAFLSPPKEQPLLVWVRRVWFALNLVILVTVVLYGAGYQPDPWMRDNFLPLLVGLIILCFAGQFAAHFHFASNVVYQDRHGVLFALLMNVAMSALFLRFYHDRIGAYGGEGLSLGVAWFKMIGTALIGIANGLIFYAFRRCVITVSIVPGAACPGGTPDPLPQPQPVPVLNFLWIHIFLYVAILVLDVAYIWLLYR
jgi:hypothetical protein